MADEREVRVQAWPDIPAKLEHQGAEGNPVKMRVGFDPEPPATVVLRTQPEGALDVQMAMQLLAERPVPLCIRLCEPICVTSEYRIAVDIFDRPVMNVTVRGTTRFAECDDEGPT